MVWLVEVVVVGRGVALKEHGMVRGEGTLKECRFVGRGVGSFLRKAWAACQVCCLCLGLQGNLRSSGATCAFK